MDSNIIHWDKRASDYVKYKGEVYYTITPLPLYFQRRELLLKLVAPILCKYNQICDFGCGDGYYVRYLKRTANNEKSIVGVDKSKRMIERAQKEDADGDYHLSINELGKFDLIYSFSVLAHISDNIITDELKNLREHLTTDGKFMFFEQVAPFSYGGKNFKRRTINEYSLLLK